MKTAVDWLVDHLYLVIPYEERNFLEGLRKEALEKEKEQIIDFHIMLMKKGLEQEGNEIEWNYDELKKEAEEYYNQTYNQNK
jgi:hypothetical protein